MIYSKYKPQLNVETKRVALCLLCMSMIVQGSSPVAQVEKVSYTDFRGPGSTYIGKVGITAYKNYNSSIGKDALFSEHIFGLAKEELNMGAHYYVQSPYTQEYSWATGTTDLSRVKVDGKGRRNAFICMQALGLTSFDVCIAKTSQDDGWYAYLWSPKYKDEYVSDDIKKRYNDLRYVRIYVNAYDTSSYNTVKAVWYFYNGGGNRIGREVKYFSKPLGSYFESAGGKPYVRFGRFMSLVPKQGYSDSADESYLKGGNLYRLWLYKGSWANFDMSRIDYAWSVQGANILSLNISKSSAPTTDGIDLIHRYNLH